MMYLLFPRFPSPMMHERPLGGSQRWNLKTFESHSYDAMIILPSDVPPPGIFSSLISLCFLIFPSSYLSDCFAFHISDLVSCLLCRVSIASLLIFDLMLPFFSTPHRFILYILFFSMTNMCVDFFLPPLTTLTYCREKTHPSGTASACHVSTLPLVSYKLSCLMRLTCCTLSKLHHSSSDSFRCPASFK